MTGEKGTRENKQLLIFVTNMIQEQDNILYFSEATQLNLQP